MARASTTARPTKGPPTQPPPDVVIDAGFKDFDTANQAFTNNITPRIKTLTAYTGRAQKVFANFSLTSFSAAERADPSYLGPGGSLAASHKAVINQKIAALRVSPIRHAFTITANADLNKLLTPAAGPGGLAGTFQVNDLLSYIGSRINGVTVFPPNSSITECEAETEAQNRINQITNPPPAGSGATAGGSTTPGGDSDDTTTAQDADASQITADTLVKDMVDLQMDTATSPETRVVYDLPDRSKELNGVHDNIQSFELRAGPSDVTAYHDFHNLQIAFQSIWTEVFDAQVMGLGQELYQEYVKLKNFSGTDDGTDPTISTIDDLRNLMDEIQNFTQQTVQNIAPGAVTPSPSTTGTPGTGSVTTAAAGAGIGAAAAPLIGLDPITGAIVGAVMGWLGL